MTNTPPNTLIEKPAFIAFLLIGLISLMMANSALLLPALSSVKVSFSASDFSLAFSIILTPVAAALLTIPFGIICDRQGRKFLLFISAFAFLSGTLLCFLAPHFSLFITGRAFQSIGDAGLNVAVFTLISDLFQGKLYARFISLLNGASALTGCLSPFMGSLVLYALNWRWIFFILFLLTFLLSFLTLKVLPKETPLPRSEKQTIEGRFSSFFVDNKITNLALCQGVLVGFYSAFYLNSPFILIDTFNVSLFSYSFYQSFSLVLTFLGSIAFVFLLQRGSFESAYRFIFVAVFIAGLTILFLLATKLSLALYLVVLGLASFLFPMSITYTMTMALEGLKVQKGFINGLFLLYKNLLSAGITLFTQHFLESSLSQFFLAALPFPLLALWLLFKTRSTPAFNKSIP
jgi:MFS family permease